MQAPTALLLLWFSTALAYPEYQQELPNIPVVHGQEWQGVGHFAREGGGRRNPFGQDFAASGHTWTVALCEKDSDGDGFTNGQELGDPECKWTKGQPRPPPNTYSISHPGLSTSVPQIAPATPAPNSGSASLPSMRIVNSTSSTAETKPSNVPSLAANTAAVPARPVASTEPNPDMEAPRGSERNLNGDKPQNWCEERGVAAQGIMSASHSAAAAQRVGSNAAWWSFKLPPVTVLGASDRYTCHTFTIPDSIPDHREFVAVRAALGGGSHLHHVLLMECPADLWFLQDVTRSTEACTLNSGGLYAACNRWWLGTERDDDYKLCTPPGLIYGRVGELRTNKKVMVLQVHWVFGSKLQDQRVVLNDTELQLLHEDPPTGVTTQIMETADHTAIYPPSALLQHVNSLVIPANQVAYTSQYSCGRRCTFGPLGGLSGKPVNIAAYTFHGHLFMTGMRMGIRRCPLTHAPDVTWEVTDWQNSAVHFTYDVRDQGIKLYPGDQLWWACTYNTSGVNRTVYGGYGGYHEEMCIMNLHYYPRVPSMRGCAAVPPHQGGDSVCMYEMTGVLQKVNQEADVLPVRTLVAPHAMLPLHSHPEPGMGYTGSIFVFWILAITCFLWACSFVLARCRWLGAVHKAYCSQPLPVRRNIPVYVMHIVVDTVLVAVWFEAFFGGFCGCTETAATSGRLLGFILLYIVVGYAIELVWRTGIGAMLAIHHVATILIIAVMAGEILADLYKFTDPAIVLAVFALLEQPTYVALLLQRLLRPGSMHVVRAWRTAVFLWFVTKTLSVPLAAWLIARDWDMMPAWVRGMYIGVWVLMYGVQVWSGFIQYSIYHSVLRKAQQSKAQQLLPTVDGQSLSGGKQRQADCEMDVCSDDGDSPTSGTGSDHIGLSTGKSPATSRG